MPLDRTSLNREIVAVRRSLLTLNKALARLATQAMNGGSQAIRASGRPRRKLKISPARRKALQLHGRYMGFVRQLKPRAKAQVKAIRATKGVKAAIAKARKLAAA